jgi:gliding motility-associated-like protein
MLLAFLTSAQQEATVWYFGDYAGLDFGDGSPDLLTNSAMYAGSGCAAISDQSGYVLFYTNGNTVWNRNHQQMPNGAGLNGSQLLNQNSLIVPRPLSDEIYYLFTINANYDSVGLNYSIVDMSLDNSYGDVSEKNQLLAKGLLEKITGARHCNGKDIWIVGHDHLDGYYSFLLSSDSLSKQPVKSNTGNNAKGDIGYLKMSPASNHIAMPLNNENLLVELCRFQNKSGEVFSPLKIYAIDNTVYAYGLEYSADGNFLYISTGGKSYKVWQYDIRYKTEEELNNSAVLIAEGNHFAMQLAPDGRMYMAKENRDYLSVIEKPNSKGTDCNYNEFGVGLDGRNSLMGLPNFLPFYFYQPGLDSEGSCLGDSTLLSFPQYLNSDSISWDFGDGSKRLTTTSTAIVKHFYQDVGTYTAEINLHHCGMTDTVSQMIKIGERPEPNLGNDTTICNYCTLTLDGGDGMDYWIWQDGDEGRFYQANKEGLYVVNVWKGECTESDSIYLTKETMQVSLPTAFSPNDDGLNDEFKPISNEILNEYRMIVFNRWGNLVFETTLPEQGWNGNCPGGPCQPGVYNWKINYSILDGNSFVAKSKKGTVVLLK